MVKQWKTGRDRISASSFYFAERGKERMKKWGIIEILISLLVFIILLLIFREQMINFIEAVTN